MFRNSDGFLGSHRPKAGQSTPLLTGFLMRRCDERLKIPGPFLNVATTQRHFELLVPEALESLSPTLQSRFEPQSLDAMIERCHHLVIDIHQPAVCHTHCGLSRTSQSRDLRRQETNSSGYASISPLCLLHR